MEPMWIDAWSLADGERRVSTLFSEHFGASPATVASAPGRVNLIGEHVDYNSGLAVPIALPHRTFVAISPREDDVVRVISGYRDGDLVTRTWDQIRPGAVTGWSAYVIGVLWALRESGHQIPGCDIAVESCVPAGAGLSSSAALEAAVAVGLDRALGLGLLAEDDDRVELARLCVTAENDFVGAPTGGLDQTASLRARVGKALVIDFDETDVSSVSFTPGRQGLGLVVIDTRAERRLTDGRYAARRATCEQIAAELGLGSLREIADSPDSGAAVISSLDDGTDEGLVKSKRLRHVTTEISRVRQFTDHIRANELVALGRLMDESHISLRDDYEVSCTELDLAVVTAKSAGAVGARMTGGGFGGSAICLAPLGKVASVAAAVTAAFVERGLPQPYLLAATASAAAS